MFFDSGTRTVSALMLVPPAMVVILEHWQRDRLQTLFLSILGGTLLAMLVTFQLFFREKGSSLLV